MRMFSKTRLIIVFSLMVVMFMFFGAKDLIQEATGSHANIEDLDVSEFRKGDIVKGKITETLGVAIEETETSMILGFIPSSKRTSAYYFVIPYFKNVEDMFPEKIVLYRTGNRQEMDTLEKLTDETYDWYSGELTRTYNHLDIERAEVIDMDAQDEMYLNQFLDEFVTVFFSEKMHDEALRKYKSVVVPYVVKINRSTGFMFFVGLGILAIGVLVFIFIRSRKRAPEPTYSSYTGYGAQQQDNSYPQQNSPYSQQNSPYSQQNGLSPTGNPSSVPGQTGSYQNREIRPDLYSRGAGFDRFSANDADYGTPLDGDSMPSVGRAAQVDLSKKDDEQK